MLLRIPPLDTYCRYSAAPVHSSYITYIINLPYSPVAQMSARPLPCPVNRENPQKLVPSSRSIKIPLRQNWSLRVTALGKLGMALLTAKHFMMTVHVVYGEENQ